MGETKEKEKEKEKEEEAGPTVLLTALADRGATQSKQPNVSLSTKTLSENESPKTHQTKMKKTTDDEDTKDSKSVFVEIKPVKDSPIPNPAEENAEHSTDVEVEAKEFLSNDHAGEKDTEASTNHVETAETTVHVKIKASKVSQAKAGNVGDNATPSHFEPVTPPPVGSSDIQVEFANGEELKSEDAEKNITTLADNGNSKTKQSFIFDDSYMSEGNESGTEEDQSSFMIELENFFKERNMEFKPPKFYGEGLNCLKLWRAVMRLGGYEKVTSSKLWRQVGESFKPPKTCTTVSWTFRGFYEKALLDYERHKTHGGELSVPVPSQLETTNVDNQASGSGRARRDAAARAMQGWHSQRVLGNEVSDPIIKDKNSASLQKREKQLKTIGLLKRKKTTEMDTAVKSARTKISKSELEIEVVDIGPPADWVKINVQKTKDCYEIYALVPGLLREEVRVQSDPAGRLVIFGEPEHLDNPWGVTAFKKIVTLPSRIDPHQTSAVVTLHGQLFVRVPFEQAE